MKINKKSHNKLHSGDVLSCQSADKTDYYLVSRISNDKYALVASGTADNDCSNWINSGNLTINGADTLNSTEDFTNSIEELIKDLSYAYDYIHKVDATLKVIE